MIEKYLHMTLETFSQWVTVGSGITTVFLTIIIIVLTVRDRKKTIAINELKQQTRHLENLYTLRIRPQFTIDKTQGDTFTIKNIGGDAEKLKITSDKAFPKVIVRFIENFEGHFSSQTQKKIPFKTITDHILTFSFNDIYGNRYEQNLDIKVRYLSNLKKLS